MTNFELYKPYKTRGGWKAVVLKIHEAGGFRRRGYSAWHEIDGQIREHEIDDALLDDTDYDLISEWSEPIKRTFYFTTNGKLFTVNSSLQEAENHIKNAVDWEIFRIDYVQGATHYVAKGE